MVKSFFFCCFSQEKTEKGFAAFLSSSAVICTHYTCLPHAIAAPRTEHSNTVFQVGETGNIIFNFLFFLI